MSFPKLEKYLSILEDKNLAEDLNKSGLRAVPGAPHGQHLASRQLVALPSYPPPSLPLWVSSLHVPYLLLPAFPPHFWIFAAQPLISDIDLDLLYKTSSFHLSSLLMLHIPCYTQDQFVYSSHFVFSSFAPLVLLVLMVLCFKKKLVLNQVFVPLLFVVSCCFNSIVWYWCILEVSWGHCFAIGFCFLLSRFWCRCRTGAEHVQYNLELGT
jgi:hypothetical protein